jgi:hypothetical protein
MWRRIMAQKNLGYVELEMDLAPIVKLVTPA